MYQVNEEHQMLRELVKKFVLESSASLVASNDTTIIDYLKAQKLDYQAMGKDAAWAAQTVKSACDNVQYYWTSSYYKTYPEYSKLPDGAAFLLKGASGQYDDKVLAEVEKGDFDLAILDVNLKGESVWPVASALRSKGTPFVLASGGHVDPPPAEFAGVPMIEKPYTIDRVTPIIDAALAGKVD